MSALGAMVVKVALDYAEFTTGIKRTEQETLQFAKKVQTNFDSVGSGITGLVGKLGGLYLGIQGVSKAIGAIDSYTKFNAQLSNATKSIVELQQAQANVSSISAKAQVDIEALGSTYARISNALKDTGATQKQVSDITETLSLALKANGATTEESASALLQLSQAFGKGKLDGDEFRAAMESAPNVMRALAASMGVPFGALKDLAKQGRITIDVMLKAFTDPALLKALTEQAEKTKTITGEWQVFTNQFTVAIGKINEATGASKLLIKSLETAATLLSIFQGGEKGSILRDFLDSGNKQVASQLAKLNQAQLAEAAKFGGPALAELNRRNAQVSARPLNRALDSNLSAPNFSVVKKDGTGGYDPRVNNQKLIEEAERKHTQIVKQNAAERKRIYENGLASHRQNMEAIAREWTDFFEGQQKARNDVVEASQSYTDSLNKELQTVQDQIDVLRLGEDGFNRLQITRLQDAVATNEQTIANAKLNGATQEVIAYAESYNQTLKAQLDIKRQLADAQLSKNSFEAEKKRIDDLQKTQTDAIKKAAEEAQRAAEDINRSITDALLRGFESGKGFAKNFKDTLINLFKTLVLRPIINFLVDSSGISKLLGGLGGLLGGSSADGAEVLTGTGSKSIFGQLSSIKDIFSGGNNFITSSIEKLGAFISNGQGGILDKIGGFLGQHAAGIANGFSYLGAGLQALKGNFAGAALTAVGTAIGGPIGGAIGSFVGSLFGGKKLPPRVTESRYGSFSKGIFSGREGIDPGKRKLGAAAALDGINEQFSRNLDFLLSSFGVSQDIGTSSLLTKKKNTTAAFGATLDGVLVGSYKEKFGKKGDFSKMAEAIANNALGPVLVQAIQASKLEAGIKKFFDGLVDKGVVSDAINTLVSFKNQLIDLPPIFNSIRDAIDTTAYRTSIADLKTRFAAIGTYTNLFYTEQENFDTFTRQLTRQFTDLNSALPSTRDGFRNLVDGLMNDFTEAGRAQFNGLVALAPAADAYYKQLQQQKEALDGLNSSLGFNEGQFTTRAEKSAYLGIARNYDPQLAYDFVSNLGAGNIKNTKTGATQVDNVISAEVVQLLRDLRDFAKQNLLVTEGSMGSLQRIETFGVKTNA